IDVEYWRGSSTQVSERALSEWRAGRPGFDVVEGNRGVQLIMKEEGLFAKYVPPAAEKFPAQFKEKDALITPWRVLPISILYNTELVKPNEVPKTLDDLLNPKWTGKLSIPDQIEGNRGVQLIMKEEGLFAKYVPPAAEKFPAQFKEKDALITPWRVLPISILYNTELVKPNEVPKTLDDLLNPKWTGKLSIPDPTRHTTTAQFLRNLEKFKGDKWLDYVKALAKQKPILVESLAPVTTTIIKGEAAIGITYIEYIKQYKGPVSYVSMDKYLTDPNYMSLSGKATHMNAAKLYIDFACTPEGQKHIAEDGEFVLAPGVYPPIKDADKV